MIHMGKIITIGREFGSGGREVGKRLSDELGIAYYDNEIITEIAKRTELAEGYVQHVMENGPTALMPITIGRTFYMGADPVMEQNNAIYREQSLLSYADMESRMERCRKRAPEQEHFTDKELRRHIQDVDKRRSKYYQFFTGQTWGEKLNYDLCINTSGANIEDLVKVIAKLVK